MIEYTTKYDVRKTMYQKFAESVAKRGDKPCFYYYNNTLTWNQVADLGPQYAPVHCRHLCGE